MNRKLSLALISFGISTMALAGVKVTSLDLNTNGPTGYVNISLDGRSNELPDVRVYGNTIEITLAHAEAFGAIFKTVRGAQLSANALNGKAVIKAVLPYSVPTDGVNIGWKNSNIEVMFPRGVKTAYEGAGITPKEIVPAPTAPAVEIKKVEVKPQSKIVKQALNEDYLNKLMNEEVKPVKEAEANKAEATVNETELNRDEVKVQQSAIERNITTAEVAETKAAPKNIIEPGKANNNFSFAGYAAKFTVFLALVLGLFYGVVQLLKKGVFKKGKLGFLNNSQMIEVLNTTYIAPKRSLMVVKVHKQIFLVSNSESGLTLLAEMNDTTGLVKEGEKLITGTNFDLNLGSANNKENLEAFIKVKENIMESTPVDEEKGLAKIAVAKDIVKFSDELKKKAKKLKPIEFN